MKQFLGVVVSAILLSACGATTENAHKTADSTPDKAGISTPATSTQTTPVEKSEEVAALPEKPDVSEKEVLKAEPEVEIPSISILKGKSVADILALLGPPKLRRKDSPAEVWQYLTASCALHLVFYPDVEDDGLKVSYYAMNDREAPKEIAEKRCFRSQLRRVGFEKLKSLS